MRQKAHPIQRVLGVMLGVTAIAKAVTWNASAGAMRDYLAGGSAPVVDYYLPLAAVIVLECLIAISLLRGVHQRAGAMAAVLLSGVGLLYLLLRCLADRGGRVICPCFGVYPWSRDDCWIAVGLHLPFLGLALGTVGIQRVRQGRGFVRE